jgi:hypothetical protein
MMRGKVEPSVVVRAMPIVVNVIRCTRAVLQMTSPQERAEGAKARNTKDDIAT